MSQRGGDVGGSSEAVQADRQVAQRCHDFTAVPDERATWLPRNLLWSRSHLDHPSDPGMISGT